MALLAIPNVSEGRDPARISSLANSARNDEARVLDVHSDPDHDRSVLTVVGSPDGLVAAMASLAGACSEIDLELHRGAHPRLGVLDVCPIVPHDEPMGEAVRAAHTTGDRIVMQTGLPVYFYGEAALRPETEELSEIRRGGLERLVERAVEDLPPDIGPPSIDLNRGVVCVGARGVLIAFNVCLDAPRDVAVAIAGRIRESSGGLPGVRAMGFELETRGLSQVSMNLIEPRATGIEAAFEATAKEAQGARVEVVATEIVGLVPQRYLPPADAEAARLLRRPGRSLESMLNA